MRKINLSTGEVRPTIDLDALLEDAETPSVRTALTVRTVPVHTNVHTNVHTKSERIDLRVKEGTKAMLNEQAILRGFEDTSDLIRSALRFALAHNDFGKKVD